MSICISVKVGEGLVFGADSIVTISGEMGRQKGVLNTYNYARKLSHLGDYPIGILNWGMGQIGARNIESLVNEFENNIPDKSNNKDYKLHSISNDFYDFINERYNKVYSSHEDKNKPVLGIQVGGYSDGAFFPEQYVFQLPIDKSIVKIREDNPDGSPNFGANWFGQTDAIVRMYKGYDQKVIENISKHFKISKEDLEKIINKAEYPVVYDGMPLQDAIDFVQWLISIVIGRFRFVVGAPTCGGDVDIAVIQPHTFTWVRRKQWKV